MARAGTPFTSTGGTADSACTEYKAKATTLIGKNNFECLFMISTLTQ
ncbi:hypothetical protein CRENPOLYSF2_3310003 [Crenothrix polyspora]|uniref:Uncharacterized protein n=1 Tax=Crenothrix polyspora TaxID=360316 RepID=A0A1R4HB57_9GAMM|nr:hypothetical protein CRENPOLYSF2_3310003 [Crenothrix polyspora]